MFLRYWKLGAAVVVALFLVGAILSFGHERYEAGKTAERARWQARFDQAQQDLVEANARVQTLEAAQIAISDDYARRFDESNQIRADRAAAADARIRQLLRDLAARARDREMCAVPITAPEPDEPAPVVERIERAGERFGRIGAGCESDARTLNLLQQWVRAQTALMKE